MVVSLERGPYSGLSEATRGFLSKPLRMLIGDEWVEPVGGGTLPVIDPSTEEEIAVIPSAGAEDVDRAVAVAREAFEDGRWSRVPPAQQTRVLLRLADLIEENADELAELQTIECGKPVASSRAEILGGADMWRYYAGWPTKIFGTVNPTKPEIFGYTLREPLGVCAGIIPYNGPLSATSNKGGPALASGNTLIMKPDEHATLSVLRFGELCLEAGIPPGVVNVVPGVGEVAGAALVAHPEVDKISFTGSVPTGRIIARDGAATLKRVSLELGGKSPILVFADADLDALVPHLFSARGFWAGSAQACIAGSRLLVERSIHDDLVEAAVQQSQEVRMGPALDPSTQIGPIVSGEQFGRILEYLDVGKQQGATPALGGERFGDTGYFVQPTIFTGVSNDMRIAQEEIFGPVMAVIPFDTEEEAIAIANDTEYGLASGVWTENISRAHRVARALKAGNVWINSYIELDPAVSWGGYKQSGYGRKYGYESIEDFTQTKAVYARLERAPMP